MTSKQNPFGLTDTEMQRLLNEVNAFDDDIEIMSEEEVQAIEADFQAMHISRDIDERQLQHIEESRKELFEDVSPLPSIIERSQQLKIDTQELMTQLRLSIDMLMKLEQRILDWVPDALVEKLASVLNTGKAELYLYLQQPPEQLNIAASSRQPPTTSRTQSWQEAVETSQMSDSDKTFWLSQS